MKAIIIETIIGVFGTDENGSIISESLYPNEPKRIASIISSQRQGLLTKPIDELINKLLKSGVEQIVSINSALLDSINKKYGIMVNQAESLTIVDDFQKNIAKLAYNYGLIENVDLFGNFSHKVTSMLAKEEVHKALSDRESLLIPTVQLLEELDTILNNLSSRMREWYGVHFPELGKRVEGHQEYATIITNIGNRKNLTVNALQEMSFKKGNAKLIVKLSEISMGASFDLDDLEVLKKFAQQTLNLYQYRNELSEYIGLLSKELSPNLYHIAGKILGAKLIEKAGGLKKIAMMPSSTIQVLGAEKALFRALKNKAKPPKHGLIFQHPYVHNAPKALRGRRARSLASKIAIAARADWFSGNFIADDLVKQLK
jgi:nucleolar protein 56